MNDQCKHCTVRGDRIGCLSTGCSQHKSWFAQFILEQNRIMAEYLDPNTVSQRPTVRFRIPPPSNNVQTKTNKA